MWIPLVHKLTSDDSTISDLDLAPPLGMFQNPSCLYSQNQFKEPKFKTLVPYILNFTLLSDVHWVWHVHMLAPQTYRQDLQRSVLGRPINHR